MKTDISNKDGHLIRRDEEGGIFFHLVNLLEQWLDNVWGELIYCPPLIYLNVHRLVDYDMRSKTFICYILEYYVDMY